MSGRAFSTEDVAYVEANFFTLDELCAGRPEAPADVRALIARRILPGPAYTLDDGDEMFPADYFVLVDQAGGAGQLHEYFAARHRRAGGDPGELENDWEAYIDGTYGVCLRQVSPETIVRKGELVSSLGGLLAEPDPRSDEWHARLRREIWELDALERPFSPDHDRGDRFGRPPTRDLLVATAHDRYPDLFAPRAAMAE